LVELSTGACIGLEDDDEQALAKTERLAGIGVTQDGLVRQSGRVDHEVGPSSLPDEAPGVRVTENRRYLKDRPVFGVGLV
jgi:hypothetical protein